MLSGAVAFVVGRPILKLKGHYLAVATLGFGVLVAIVLTNEAGWTGGPDGMGVPHLMLFDWKVHGSDAWYWIAGVTFVGGFMLATNLRRQPERPRACRRSTTARSPRACSASTWRARS